MRSLNKKIKSLFLLISFAAYMPISIAPSLAIDVNTTPELGSSVNGGAVGVNGTVNGKTNFEVNMADGAGKNAVGIFNWNKFDVGKNVAVNWVFNQTGQKAVNRVMNTGKMSEIYGTLMSSCKTSGCNYANKSSVLLINPNGIMFGEGSQVNIGSFTASTRDIKGLDKAMNDFMNGANVTVKTGKKADGSTFTYNSYGASDVINTKFGNNVPITFDTSTVDSKGNGVITLDGAQFNNTGFGADGEPVTKATSVALVADKIDIKNHSIIQTHESAGNQGNFGSGDSRSNVKLITSDGVTFSYGNWGQISEAQNGKNAVVLPENPSKMAAGKTKADYGISISGDSQIYSGSVQAVNNYEGADINLNNSTLWGRKLYNGTSGEIVLKSEGDINLINSRVETITRQNNNSAPNNGVDSDNPAQTNAFGNITIKAENNILVDNTRIQSAESDKSAPSALITDKDGNKGYEIKPADINIIAKKGNVTIQKSAEALAANGGKGNTQVIVSNTESLPIDIISKGNLRIESDYGTVKTDLKGTNTQIAAKYHNRIGAKNIELNGGIYGSQQGNMEISAGTLLKNNNTGLMDILGGGIKINDAVVQASRGELAIEGLETTIANTALDYKNLSLYNDYYVANNLNHDVLIKDGTTFYDREVEAGNKDTLEITTTGQLIFDHNELKKADFDNTRTPGKWLSEATNQKDGVNVKLTSTQSQVSIRNNSNIVVDKNITLNGKTNANVATSDVTSKNGNIIMNGGTKVTVGNAIDQIEGDTNVITKKGSNLIANNGDIILTATGDVKDPTAVQDIRGITVLHSNLASKNNTLTANNGDVSIQTSTVTATNNNRFTADNGRVGIQNHIEKDGTVCGPSTVTAGNQSDIIASGDVIITKSKVKSKNNNNITSKKGKVYSQGQGALIQSTDADVTINQELTANLDNDFDQAQGVKAKNNVNFTVKGVGQNINSNGTVSSLNSENGRVALNANNDINIIKDGSLSASRMDFTAGNNVNLRSSNGALTLNNTTFNAKNNNIQAKNDVTINNNMTINKGRTTIKSENGNVKTNAAENGVINAKSNKLIVNAKKDIDIAFTGVDNKNAGLEINSDVNTSNIEIAASGRKEDLAGRNVKLTAKDNQLAISKIKADRLEIANPETVNLKAATDNKPNAATDNIGPNPYTANVGTAYIEVQELNGWNMDSNATDVDNIPGFYKGNYDQASDGNTQRHFIQFGNNENMLLVYQRATEKCDDNVGPGDDPVIAPSTLNESAMVRLPRHEEGVSAVAPVLNEITDPTANVIMAAARITLDEEDEATDEDGDAIR